MSRQARRLAHALVMAGWLLAGLGLARAASGSEDTPSTQPAPAERVERPSFQPEIRVFALKHAHGKELASALSSLFDPGDGPRRIVWYAPTNTLIVRAPEVDTSFMEKLVEQIDVAPPETRESPPAPQGLRIIPIHHAGAMDLLKVLEELVVAPGGRGGRSGSQDAPPRWAVDERTNTIAMLGTEAQINRALELVKALDVPFEQPKPKASRDAAKGKKEPSGE